jgi:hypothetical protein
MCGHKGYNARKGLVAGLVDLGPTSSAVDVGRCDRAGMMKSTVEN